MFAFLAYMLLCSNAYSAQYRAALVADMDTGRVLYQENANELNYPASLTKIMTLYLTFDALEHGRLALNDYLIVSQAAANAEPVKLGLTICQRHAILHYCRWRYISTFHNTGISLA